MSVLAVLGDQAEFYGLFVRLVIKSELKFCLVFLMDLNLDLDQIPQFK